MAAKERILRQFMPEEQSNKSCKNFERYHKKIHLNFLENIEEIWKNCYVKSGEIVKKTVEEFWKKLKGNFEKRKIFYLYFEEM